MLTWLLFFFVAFGSKVLLAFAMIWFLFPADRTCSECDGETLAVRMGPVGRALAVLMRGRLQRRWCPRCGWEGLTRTGARRRPARTRSTAGPETPVLP